MVEAAIAVCGCKPFYIDNSTKVPCDVFGTICFEESIAESIENGTQNLNKEKSCYPACKYIMYSLQEAAKGSMEDKWSEIDTLGEDVSTFFDKSVLLSASMHTT